MASGTAIAARLSEAHLALLRGNHGETIAACRSVLDDAPDSAAACYLMGCAQEAAGRGEEALHWIGRAIDLDPHRDEWRAHLDRLVRHESRRPARRLPVERVAKPEATEAAAWRRNPKVIAALSMGAALSLAGGLWTGQRLYVPKDHLPKPLPPAARSLEPIVVANPAPPAPSSGANPKDGPEARRNAPARAAGNQSGEWSPVSVQGADTARFDSALRKLWIRVAIAPGAESDSASIAATAESIARAAVTQFPEARSVILDAVVPTPEGGFRDVWSGEASVPWPDQGPLLRPRVPGSPWLNPPIGGE